ncbi:peptidyl-tRNA hydrolase domain-containing protein [Xylaria digitata]|nr:peptidyl-tRNA hydrolase domain-containing protein [Xylaria digitata]
MPLNSLIGFTRPPFSTFPGPSLIHLRRVRYQAYDALFDQDDLDEAQKWHVSFSEKSLPKGQTSYSRSSGPGGQHVNKTESKAISVWPVSELSKGLPKLMRSALRSSRYYSMRNDSITIQAQTQRSRTANTDENRQKLAEELHRIFCEQVPTATSEKKIKKHEEIEKAFHQGRLKAKKQQASKKSSRKGGGQHE